MKRASVDSFRRGWAMFVVVPFIALASGSISAGAVVPTTGTVQYPCGYALIQRVLADPPVSLQNGKCGFKVSGVTAGKSFRLHPHVAADLDVIFYSSAGGALASTGAYSQGENAGCGDVVTGSNQVGRVPAGTSYAIVVLWVSNCGAKVWPVTLPNITYVTFTYSEF